jgi:hypothetical protein
MPRSTMADTNCNSAEHAPESAQTGARAPEYGPDTPVETATEARQGVIEHKVSTVLIVSTGAVILAFVLIYAAFFA